MEESAWVVDRFRRIEKIQDDRDAQWSRLVADQSRLEIEVRELRAAGTRREAARDWMRRALPFALLGVLFSGLGTAVALWKAFHP